MIGGGKFGNGAMTGAFNRLFNEEPHQLNRNDRSRFQTQLGKNIDNCLADAECVSGYSFDGSRGYGPDTYKCSYWVHDMIELSGGNAPMRDPVMPSWLGGTSGPASASDWHNPDFSIPGCRTVATPQNYDIYSDGVHMGIVYSTPGGGTTVSASPYGVRPSGNRSDSTVYRRCNW